MGRLIRPGYISGLFDTAWLYKWAVWYGPAVQVGCLIRPGRTSGLFDTVWLKEWTVWYGLIIQVGCLHITNFLCSIPSSHSVGPQFKSTQ